MKFPINADCKLMTCIIFDFVTDVPVPRKYHNIPDNQRGIAKFERFAKSKFPNGRYYNCYDKKSKLFLRRSYLVLPSTSL